MTTKPSYTPALRFPDFLNVGEWEVKRLGEIVTVNYGRDYKHLNPGNIPVYGTGGYMLSVDDKLSDTDAIGIGRKGTIDKPQYLKAPFWTVDTLFFLTTKNGYDIRFVYCLLQTIDWKKYSEQTGVPSLTRSSIEKIEVRISPLAEQQRIAACLSSMDELLSATNGKLEQLKAYKKGMMQKLFPAKGKKLPELRFKEFEKDGEWEVKKLGEVTKDVNRRNKSNRNLPIYSISNKDGFILQSEQFDGLDSVSRGYDTSLYKIVTSNTFAYNPARINVGSIGYSGNIKECLISSLYVCFKTTEDVDDSFLMYFFDTSSFNHSVENNVEGGIRSYLFYENFSKIKIMFPSISEQKRIVSFLKAIDEIIDALSNKFSELERYKIGMMQKMFPIIK